MERRDWETLILALENLGLALEKVDPDSGLLVLRVPDLREKRNYHL